MAVRFLLDEHVGPQVSDRLDEAGYDVERVPDVPELGAGATDREIAAYSTRTERVVVTYDDFVTELDASAFHCAVFFEDATLTAREVAAVLDAMAAAYPAAAFTGVQHGSRAWL